MTKLSKSIYVLLAVDVLIFLGSTYLAGIIFDISFNLVVLTGILFCLSGIYSLSLKGYYSIRKFNFFLKDAYFLLESLFIVAVIPSIIVLSLEFNKLIFLFLLTNAGILYIFLLIWRSGFYQYRKNFKKAKNILIIGAGNSGKEISREIVDRPELKFNIVGFIDNDEAKLNIELNGIKVIGKTYNLKKLIEKNKIKLVIIAITGKIEHQALMDISECVLKEIDIYKMPDIYEKITQKVPVGIIAPDWFIYDFTRIERPLYTSLKKIFDIVAAVIILGITFPVLVIVGVNYHQE